MMALPARIRRWVLNLFDTNVGSVTFKSYIETSRFIMSEGHRKFLPSLPNVSDIQIPGSALFIPFEMVKIYGTQEIEYTGWCI